jgi:hypothetical protein
MSSTTYDIIPTSGILSHGLYRVLTCQDVAAEDREELLRQIHEGEYFVCLAKTLRTVIQNLSPEATDSRHTLENAIRDLEYLQKYYEII